MNKKRWFLSIDIKSMLLPYLMYIAYLFVLCLFDRPFSVGLQWRMFDAPPEIEVFIYPYILIGTALFTTFCVVGIFSETYRKNSASYMASLRPSVFQLFYKRIIAVIMAMSVPLITFLSYAFWRINSNYSVHITDSEFDVIQKSEYYGYPIPDCSEYFLNIFVQILIALIAFIMINLAILTISRESNVSVLVFISYCTAEYFGLRYVFCDWGILSSVIENNMDIENLIPSYTITHIVVSAICFVVATVITHLTFSKKSKRRKINCTMERN